MKLHYKLRGNGPLLLILQGGDGNADATDRLADHLVDHYTVLTHDRRGLSRSPIDDPDAAIDLSTHSQDVSHLLAALTDEPALVFGSSIGALIGLDLISRHPEQVRLLIAHEPPATHLLPEPERDQAAADQEEVETLYRRHGLREAMTKFMAIAAIRYDDREDDVEIPPPAPDRIANLDFFLTHDAPAVRRYRLDLPRLRAIAQRIVPAGGADAESLSRRCVHMLAAELDQPLMDFPGGHTGFLLRPRGFAARLHQVLTDSVTTGSNAADD
ncbi:MAG: alpha/beta fold hydrolase [Catenulisporales bacterium]|nr:alpha/beta fold hydrolase [Catenulisporales bacterium]